VEAKIIVEPYCHEGIVVARGKENTLTILNLMPCMPIYGEN